MARKDTEVMQEKNEELQDIKDKIIEVVNNIDDPDVLEVVLKIFELRNKNEHKDGRA